MIGRWLPTPALSSALAVLAVLPVLAVLLSRPDLLVIALPIGTSVVLGLARRSYRLPAVSLRAEASTLLEGESTRLAFEISADERVDMLRLRPVLEGWIALPDGGRQLCTTVAPGEPRRFSYRLASTRWGRGQLDSVSMTAFTAQALLRADAVLPVRVTVRILPLREGFTATDIVPNATGVVGLHRSRRVGEGVDLAGVRPFVAGDRLRRINWPVSTRTGQLHVTATYSDRDTEVVLVLDTAVEIGESSGADRSSSTIDQAVRAAGSIAEHYLRNGDRVGLLDLARPGRPIRSRSGRSQLNRLIDILLEVRGGSIADFEIARGLARISPRALVIVLSPLLSDEIANALAELTRSGRAMLVVDTLPEQVVLPEHGPWTELAWQIQMLHRDNLAGALLEHGVPIVPWLGAGSLDAVLLGLSRMAIAPRAVPR
ncbi:MAG: DUF58 domain-containing protein [Jatrophihabitantaceae bacterium]